MHVAKISKGTQLYMLMAVVRYGLDMFARVMASLGTRTIRRWASNQKCAALIAVANFDIPSSMLVIYVVISYVLMRQQ